MFFVPVVAFVCVCVCTVTSYALLQDDTKDCHWCHHRQRYGSVVSPRCTCSNNSFFTQLAVLSACGRLCALRTVWRCVHRRSVRPCQSQVVRLLTFNVIRMALVGLPRCSSVRRAGSSAAEVQLLLCRECVPCCTSAFGAVPAYNHCMHQQRLIGNSNFGCKT